MEGKYTSWPAYMKAKCKRGVLRAALRPLLKWKPMSEPKPGYTVIIGVATSLPEILHTNLTFIQQQRLDDLHEVICVFDTKASPVTEQLTESVKQAFPELPLRFHAYTTMQSRVLDAIQWGWAYAWLSWSIGIGLCETRVAVLHDYDAMVIEPEFFHQRYQRMQALGVDYFGVKQYAQNGFQQSDNLVTTFELFFDAAKVRANHRPLDLFSHVGRMGERTVDFDTFLYAQSKGGTKAHEGYGVEHLVHPSQLLCQFTEMKRSPGYKLPASTSMPMVPYFLYAGGLEESLTAIVSQLQASLQDHPKLLGHTMNLSAVAADRVEWYEIQAEQMEQLLSGKVRDEVTDYFSALRAYLTQQAAQ